MPASELQAVVVLIAAWKPDERLGVLVQGLSESGFGAMVVVDDGSPSMFEPLFESLPSVHLLRHQVNCGKGRALKTGIDYVLRSMPQAQAIVTADADGQHTPADIVRVARAVRDQDRVVLGVRTFTGDVPWRCRVGNAATRALFHVLTGVKVSDTQTGLRGIPQALLSELLRLPGERYEYEMAQLAPLCRTGRRPVEVAVETLYLDHNRSSHFKPMRDSARVLFALLRSVVRSRA